MLLLNIILDLSRLICKASTIFNTVFAALSSSDTKKFKCIHLHYLLD